MNGRGTPLHPVRFTRHPTETLLTAVTTLHKEPRTPVSGSSSIESIVRPKPLGPNARAPIQRKCPVPRACSPKLFRERALNWDKFSFVKLSHHSSAIPGGSFPFIPEFDRVPWLRRFGSAMLFTKVITLAQFRRTSPTGKSTAERQPLSHGTQARAVSGSSCFQQGPRTKSAGTECQISI
jgi:hypothetical protein